MDEPASHPQSIQEQSDDEAFVRYCAAREKYYKNAGIARRMSDVSGEDVERWRSERSEAMLALDESLALSAQQRRAETAEKREAMRRNKKEILAAVYHHPDMTNRELAESLGLGEAGLGKINSYLSEDGKFHKKFHAIREEMRKASTPRERD